MQARNLMAGLMAGGIAFGAVLGMVTPTRPLPPPEPSWRKEHKEQPDQPDPYFSADLYPAYPGYVPPPPRAVDMTPYDEMPVYDAPPDYPDQQSDEHLTPDEGSPQFEPVEQMTGTDEEGAAAPTFTEQRADEAAGPDNPASSGASGSGAADSGAADSRAAGSGAEAPPQSDQTLAHQALASSAGR